MAEPIDMDEMRQARADRAASSRARLILNQQEARRRVRFVRKELQRLENDWIAVERDSFLWPAGTLEKIKYAHRKGEAVLAELLAWQRENDPEALVKDDEDPEPEAG